jgi:threonyl-tRNA synthetase
MKILCLHSDFIKVEVKKKALKDAEKPEKSKEEVKECLVVFSSVEKRDEANPDNVAKNLVKEIGDVASQLKTNRIVLYPYVHLTSSPSSPKTALDVLNKAEALLKKEFEVTRVPFGWYKAFNIACKGHPLSELSREFGPEEVAATESKALKEEKKLKSSWYIMTTDGKLHDIGKFDFKGHENLKKFAYYEKTKVRVVTQEPEHVRLMRKLELVDYEPGSDSGNLRYYPKGRLIKSLLEQYVTERVIDYGGVEVETPIMYDMNHPTLVKYLNRFPARQYQIESDKRNFFLRFSACFGQFLMAHDATISYRNLPLKLYELTRYSFRREQTGELTGLRRLRAFTMPDVHAICENMAQALEEYKTRFKLCLDLQERIGFTKDDFELAVRVTKEFYEKNKQFVEWLVKTYGKPSLIEMWDKRFFYFVLKYELNFVDTLDKASALSTDQIDIENGERYDIKFTNKDGKKEHPLILHCSPSGAIERVMYALLEKAALLKKKGITPQLPLWLSPSQVRVIPVSDKFLEFCEKLTEGIRQHKIRADLDDRKLHVGKKIREAEVEWVPYTVVIGEKETKSKKLSVRVRGKKDISEINTEELIANIKKRTEGMPFKPLPLPSLLSKRPSFVGAN